MDKRYLIDTNVIIDNLGGKLGQNAEQFVGDIDIIISAINKIELLGWHGASVGQLQLLNSFIAAATVLPINEAVVEKTILLRQLKRMGLGDAIIAATALVHGLTLVTRNVLDFQNIDGLELVNPYEL